MVHRIPLGCWFLLGAGSVFGVQFGHLALHGWNPTGFLQVGSACPARARLERDFPDLVLESHLGHDGKYSYLVARHPDFWRADAETLEGIQDPGYRYARPLYPLLAGLAGQLPARGTLAGLILVQILAGGGCAVALAASARRSGLPPAFLMLNLANPGVASSACLLTSDLLAHALSVGAWHCYGTGRYRASLGLFALALLAKEYYALTPLALAASLLTQRKWRGAVAFGVLPPLPILVWKGFLTASVGPGDGQGNFTWPGGGIAAVWSSWGGNQIATGSLAVGLVLDTWLAAGWPKLPARLRWACAAWGLLGLCTSTLVWSDPNDLLRALCPAWWLVLVAGFTALRRPQAVPQRLAKPESTPS